ncbi:response regulator [Parerythrobacter jejuensis]|uniref:Response regulator n=1 Tax=Parerythrobacter jejuensis TaxID=795812 RepID=A0A845AQ31_9SPHN|nr:response regulator [Parerythrobacter jejuensis]MXP32952.1 response regulator [Parerythrobacter jejuensis]
MDRPVVLVAEDEGIIGIDLCDTVEEAGFEVEGPVPDVASAMLAFQKRKPDVAILDVQLGDGNVFPLAEKLIAEDVKVIFHSGNYTLEEMETRFPQATALSKPCPPQTMLANVQSALNAD